MTRIVAGVRKIVQILARGKIRAEQVPGGVRVTGDALRQTITRSGCPFCGRGRELTTLERPAFDVVIEWPLEGSTRCEAIERIASMLPTVKETEMKCP